ncbi:MAG: hypothetical protein ACF8PN_10110 [Phycisphaerales bacterium]
MSESAGSGEGRLSPRELTWAALLAQWLDFARASVAFPQTDEGARWKSSVPAIINLQAVTFALAEIDDLPADERALGVDRAEILLRENVAALHELWEDAEMPGGMIDLVDDARLALEAALAGPTIEFAVPRAERAGPSMAQSTMVMPDLGAIIDELLDAGFAGSIYAAPGGTLLLPGEPWLIISGSSEAAREILKAKTGETGGDGLWRRFVGALEPATPGATSRPRQIYRSVDESGIISQDTLAPLWGDPVAGRPLLAPVVEDGERRADLFAVPASWVEKQMRAWPREGVVVRDTTADSAE